MRELFIRYDFDGVTRIAYTTDLRSISDVIAELDLPDANTMPPNAIDSLHKELSRIANAGDVQALPCLWRQRVSDFWYLAVLCDHDCPNAHVAI